MTSTDLVVQSTAYSRASLTERQQYVAMLARAGDLLPPHLRGGMVRNQETGQMVAMGNAGKTFLLAETGDMLGIHPMAALTGVHIIEGKPSISANLMGGLVRKAGHKLRVSVTGSAEDETLKAVAVLIRQDDPDFQFEVTWDVAAAKRALLWPGKAGSNWAKYPKAMMKARVISEIIREGAPDVLMGGNVYTPEELGAAVDEQGEPIEMVEVRREAPIQDAPNVSRETRPEAAIPNERAAPAGADATPTDDFNWAYEIENAPTSEDIRVLYRKATAEGQLNLLIIVTEGGEPQPLGAVLISVGQALAQAEAEVVEDVVDAEVVE